MKNQALFSSKHKSKKLKCRLLQFLFGALRVKKCRTVGFLSASHANDKCFFFFFFFWFCILFIYA